MSESEDPQVVEAADALYAVPPDRFVAERAARVAALRAAGDRPAAAAVAALRRPTRPAWLVNLLVRERGDVVEQLLALGEALREATEQLDAASLRTLSAQRRAVVDALVREAAARADQAGAAADADVRRAVQETLEAALGDPEVAAAVRTGRLVGPREAVGFGAVAPGPRAVAARTAAPLAVGRGKATGEGRRPEPAADRSRRERAEREEAARRAKEQAAAEAAERALREAREQLSSAEAAREAAAGDAGAARERVEELRAQLVDAERRAAAAALDERAAIRAEERARHALERVERRR